MYFPRRSEYFGADKSLARPGRKQTRKHVTDARDFNNIETQTAIKFFFLQSKAPKEIHAILKETLVCFLPGRAKDYIRTSVISAVFYIFHSAHCNSNSIILTNKLTESSHDLLWLFI